MNFEEVTERLGATVNNPGGRGDGLPMNIAIPSMGNLRIWQAAHGGYTWAISFEPGLPQWSDDEKKNWIGYTASYRRADQHTSKETIRIDGGPWDTFTKAEDACKRVWKQLRAPQ